MILCNKFLDYDMLLKIKFRLFFSPLTCLTLKVFIIEILLSDKIYPII